MAKRQKQRKVVAFLFELLAWHYGKTALRNMNVNVVSNGIVLIKKGLHN